MRNGFLGSGIEACVWFLGFNVYLARLKMKSNVVALPTYPLPYKGTPQVLEVAIDGLSSQSETPRHS